jgi:hypothetical protein
MYHFLSSQGVSTSSRQTLLCGPSPKFPVVAVHKIVALTLRVEAQDMKKRNPIQLQSRKVWKNVDGAMYAQHMQMRRVSRF